MGYTWRTNTDGTADAVEHEEFAQVVYKDDQVLVVNVARGMLPDRELEDALMDALVLEEGRQDAEHAVGWVARELGFDVHPDGGNGHRALTITPGSGGEVDGEGHR